MVEEKKQEIVSIKATARASKKSWKWEEGSYQYDQHFENLNEKI